MKKSMKRTLMALALSGLGLTTFGVGASAAGKATEHSPSLSPHKILNIAHRGASGYAPEHTMASYRLGDGMKGDYIEIDLQMTKDGELIAMHDETVDRTTDGTGPVNAYTLEEIKTLDAGSWFNQKYPQKADPSYVGLQVPTLEKVIQEFGKGVNYYIETKSPEVYPGMEEKLLQTLEKYKLTGPNVPSSKVIIQSFSKESLMKVHKMDPSIPLVQLLWYTASAQISDAQLEQIQQYAIGVGMNYNMIDEDYVKNVRAHDLLIHPYTVNEKEDMKTLLEWGVTGMFTNYPNRLNEVLREYHKQ
jgi:glycerophosphoryl diester phosphodiesterase